MRPITRPLRGLMKTEVTVERGTSDNFGETTYGGAFIVKGRIKGGNKITRNRDGKEVVSTIQFTVNGVFDLSTDDRYTLPSPWKPTQPVAVNVEISTDENGPHHEKVFF